MKIRCAHCGNQINGFCSVKKATVSLNKKRICDKYKYDETKVKERHEIPSVMRSEWYWKREELKRLRKEQKEYEEQQARLKEISPAPVFMGSANSGDPKYPLTGDLSRFISTAGKEG